MHRSLQFGHAHFRKFQIPKISTEADMCAEFHDFSWSCRPRKTAFVSEEEGKKESVQEQ